MILSDGEVSITGQLGKARAGDIVYDTVDCSVVRFLGGWQDYIRPVLASTSDKWGVPHLDRNSFVIGVDVLSLAYEYSTFDQAASAWADGYNAKKAEFTLAQARTIWAAGVEASSTFEDALKIVQPIEIPESITVDDNFNVIDVKWE